MHYPGKFPPKSVSSGGEASDIITGVGDQVLEWIITVAILVLYLERIQFEEGDFHCILIQRTKNSLDDLQNLTEMMIPAGCKRLWEYFTQHIQPSSQAHKVSINIRAETLWSRRIKTNEEYKIQNYWEADIKLRGYDILYKDHCKPDFLWSDNYYYLRVQTLNINIVNEE